MYDDAGVPVALLGLFSDISERKRDEAALRGSEERFRALVDTAPVLTWLSGPEKTATYFNSPAMAFAGLPLEQLVGTNYLNLVHPEDREGYLEVIFEAANARAPFSTEVRFRRVDGEYRWLLVSGMPRITDGAYLGHVGTGVDVTDLKRSYEQHLAAQKLESLGVLAAGVAHDFNNLLGAIVGHADCAQCELDPNSPASEDIGHIRATALRAAEIVSQLMTFARQETAPPEAIDLSRLVGEMLDLLKVSISKAAVLQTELAVDLPPIRANAAEIRQVVMNLIINASEALLGNPGSITIRTTCVALDGESRAAVRLEVEDTGSGMTEDVKSKDIRSVFYYPVRRPRPGPFRRSGHRSPAWRFDRRRKHAGRGKPVRRPAALCPEARCNGFAGRVAGRSSGAMWTCCSSMTKTRCDRRLPSCFARGIST